MAGAGQRGITWRYQKRTKWRAINTTQAGIVSRFARNGAKAQQSAPLPAPISTATPINTGKDRAAHGDGLPDLPGLGGVGLPDEQRTARPITCPGCSFQPDTAAALMTPPPCCPHPCQTYRHRQPPARQHPAASPTPEGSDSPPNGIWL